MATILDSNGQAADANGRFKITAEKLITLIVTALLAYAAVTSRVAVIESKQADLERRLERIEQKLDQLIQRP